MVFLLLHTDDLNPCFVSWLVLTVEQYYTTNIQKNQLVQNDIRVAKRLQDEEDEQLAQQSTLLRQASRQL